MTTQPTPEAGDGWHLLAEGTPLTPEDGFWHPASSQWIAFDCRPDVLRNPDGIAHTWPWRRRNMAEQPTPEVAEATTETEAKCTCPDDSIPWHSAPDCPFRSCLARTPEEIAIDSAQAPDPYPGHAENVANNERLRVEYAMKPFVVEYDHGWYKGVQDREPDWREWDHNWYDSIRYRRKPEPALPQATADAGDHVHIELPSGGMASVTVEGAKDPALISALDTMIQAAAKAVMEGKLPAQPPATMSAEALNKWEIDLIAYFLAQGAGVVEYTTDGKTLHELRSRFLASTARAAEHTTQQAEEIARLKEECQQTQSMLVQSQLDILAEKHAKEAGNRRIAALESERDEARESAKGWCEKSNEIKSHLALVERSLDEARKERDGYMETVEQCDAVSGWVDVENKTLPQHIAETRRERNYLKARVDVSDKTIQLFGSWLDHWSIKFKKEPSEVYGAWDEARDKAKLAALTQPEASK